MNTEKPETLFIDAIFIINLFKDINMIFSTPPFSIYKRASARATDGGSGGARVAATSGTWTWCPGAHVQCQPHQQEIQRARYRP